MKKFLQNEVIVLRALEPDDIELLHRWENDEEIWTVSHTIVPFSRHTLALYIQNSYQDIYESPDDDRYAPRENGRSHRPFRF
jgi:diamine N-acetyltransferase